VILLSSFICGLTEYSQISNELIRVLCGEKIDQLQVLGEFSSNNWGDIEVLYDKRNDQSLSQQELQSAALLTSNLSRDPVYSKGPSF
jgi:hypothetical protein